MADAGITVNLRGLRQLFSGLDGLAEDTGDAAIRAFEAVARGATAETRGAVPYRSGRLAGSVEVEVDRPAHRASASMGDGVPYAGWIEFGGGRYAARKYRKGGRYFYPTIRKASRRLAGAGADAAEGQIRKVRWKSPRR